MKNIIFEIEKVLDFKCKNFEILKRSLIHKSYDCNIINEKQSKQDYLTPSKTNWITNDSRINDTLDPKIKNIIFKTKLNSYSKINQLEEFKYVFVKPTIQSEKFLATEQSTKTENILLNIDSNIKNDIINALLADIKIKKKSSINQNFLNSF